MRAILKKILIVLLIILVLNNFIITASFAADTFVEKLEGLVGSYIGLLTYPIRLVALGAGFAMNSLTASVAYIEGTTEGSTASTSSFLNMKIITPFDIFFNKVKILDINFFDIGTDTSIVNQIRTSVAAWYYTLRNLAAAILLVVFIYVGIRMAITTVASDKAMYKKMLVDWVASLALIFVMQYIMIFTITVNNTIIKALSVGIDSEKINNTYEVIRDLAFKITDLDSVAATVVYCMLVWQTLGLVISYFNRMLKLAFLVIISPLITLTYSIDKMGDGKAQALGSWLKEFVYTILIQPFHCIIYMCFIGVAFDLLITNNDTDRSTLAVAVVSILCVHFVKEGEKLVRKIFSFKDENSSTSMAAGLAVAGVALSQSKNIGKGARSMINGAKATKGALSSSLTGAKVGVMALSSKIANRGNEDAKGKTFAEYKSDARTKINNKKAAKMESKKYYKKSVKTANAIEREKEKIMASAPGISAKEAESIARLNVAKRARNQSGVRKHITKAKGTIGKLKDIAEHSSTLQTVGEMAKITMSAGMGLMVGSGIYGTNGSFATAVAGGAAMYSGTKEFQRTANTLESGTVDNLKGLGVKNQREAAAEMDKILSNPSLYGNGDESTEKMKELLDKVGKALEAAGVDAKYKSHVKNTIENGIKANPAQSQRIVQEALNGLTYNGKKDALDPKSDSVKLTGVANDSAGTPLTQVNNGELLNATQDLADFINRKQIYQQVQTAGNFNITADTYAGDIISRFRDTEDIDYEHNAEIIDKGTEETNTSSEYQHNRSEIDKETYGLTNVQLEELDKEFERRKEEYHREAANSDLSMDAKKAIDDAIRQLDREQTDIIARALADSDRDLTTISNELVNKYEQKLEVALKEAEEELNQQQQGYSFRTKGFTKGKLNLATSKKDRLEKTSRMWKQNVKS